MTAELKPAEEEDFKAALWDLYEKTARLPPLTDCTACVPPFSLAKHLQLSSDWANNTYLSRACFDGFLKQDIPRCVPINDERLFMMAIFGCRTVVKSTECESLQRSMVTSPYRIFRSPSACQEPRTTVQWLTMFVFLSLDLKRLCKTVAF